MLSPHNGQTLAQKPAARSPGRGSNWSSAPLPCHRRPVGDVTGDYDVTGDGRLTCPECLLMTDALCSCRTGRKRHGPPRGITTDSVGWDCHNRKISQVTPPPDRPADTSPDTSPDTPPDTSPVPSRDCGQLEGGVAQNVPRC